MKFSKLQKLTMKRYLAAKTDEDRELIGSSLTYHYPDGVKETLHDRGKQLMKIINAYNKNYDRTKEEAEEGVRRDEQEETARDSE